MSIFLLNSCLIYCVPNQLAAKYSFQLVELLFNHALAAIIIRFPSKTTIKRPLEEEFVLFGIFMANLVACLAYTYQIQIAIPQILNVFLNLVQWGQSFRTISGWEVKKPIKLSVVVPNLGKSYTHVWNVHRKEFGE